MKGIDVSAVVEERVDELKGRVSDMAGSLSGRAERAQQELQRNLRKAQGKAGAMLDAGRDEIKAHPMKSVAIFAAAGAVLGLAAGLFFSKRNRS
jgi:ElaB/YqjD/DUF883 family membrane-anchored ribosome-binding protein